MTCLQAIQINILWGWGYGSYYFFVPIHSFNKHFSSVYHETYAVLSFGDTAGTEPIPCPHGADILHGEIANKDKLGQLTQPVN